MTTPRPWIVAALTAVSLALGSGALAQDPAPPDKDKELEKLLEKLGDKPKAEAPNPGDADKDKDRDKAEPKKDADKAEPKKDADKDKDLERLLDKLDDKPRPAEGDAKDAAKKEGEDKDKDKDKSKAGKVAPKDEGLDSLLEGLGKDKDKPAPDDKKPGGAGPDDPMPPPQQPGGQPKPEDLKGADKGLDDDLAEAMGKKKPKPKRERKPGEEAGPMGQVIKEMRDVEERLGEPDTGEQTRKKQEQIVKNLDQMIEQLKNAPGGSQGMKMIRQGRKPGDQPGNPQGNQPGAQANGAPETQPKKPEKPKPLAEGMAKDIWGRLPDQFRDDMNNVLTESPLPTKADLIRRYYLSLSKKSAKASPEE